MGLTILLLWMSLTASLVPVAWEAPQLVIRGYELLPNARWLEELERDGRATNLRATLDTEARAVPPLMVASSIDLSPPDFGLKVDFRELNALRWSSDQLAGGLLPRHDPTARFWFDGENRRAKTTWWWIGQAMSFLPFEKNSDYFSR